MARLKIQISLEGVPHPRQKTLILGPSDGGGSSRPAMDWVRWTLLAALVAALPFELRFLPLASSLQWLFVLLAALCLPVLLRERKRLLSDRLVRAALVFAATQWLAAGLTPSFKANAGFAALRITMGLILLCITLCIGEREVLLRVWALAAIAAAAYALLDFAGFGVPGLFRLEEFYSGGIRRLSGTFEYPNTAAAFFSMSLPIVWTSVRQRWLRISGVFLLLAVLLLTYSRGGIVALLFVAGMWAVSSRSKPAFVLTGLGGAAVLCFVLFQPSLLRRFGDLPPIPEYGAECQPEFNKLLLPPGGKFEITLRLKNSGMSSWEADARRPFTISYRWYDLTQQRLVYKSLNFIPIPVPVRPQESVTMRVPFEVPSQAGLSMMTWDVSQSDTNRFRDHGVMPGLIEVNVVSGVPPEFGNGDLSRWMDRRIARMFVGGVSFTRSELWKAGLAMAREHPVFGVGPDNFRLLYGRYFGILQWNQKIRSNNLYLELLCGSGLAGLLAFIVMMCMVRRNAIVPVIALAVFLIHGFVDVFLMTTPIYFGFWILMALAHSPNEAEESHHAERPAAVGSVL